ncbi:MAG: rhomboid family intramembrane serine protease [Planctomycetota bacterium]|nr:rhomboid family intramembrane serine protease [Planctomycetota bacterium]
MLLPYADEAPREGPPPAVTWALIAANLAVFLLWGGRPDYEEFVQRWGFVPARASLGTALASLFLHANLLHLAGNLWFLHIFGDNVEARLGPVRFLSGYLLAGLCGAFSHYAVFSTSSIPSIGASGAIFGVMGMYMFLFPRNRVKFFYFFFILMGTFHLSAAWAIGYFFLSELLLSYFSLALWLESGIGHLAHAGGFASGFVLAAVLLRLGLIRDDRRHLWAVLSGTAPPPRADAGPPEASAHSTRRIE